MKVARDDGEITAEWRSIRERLASLFEAAPTDQLPAPSQARSILEERARQLARPVAEPSVRGATTLVVTFALGAERYAIDASFVREVTRLVDFTPVPGAGEFVGVTNLRGEILPLVNFRRFMALPEVGVTDLSWLVVLGSGRSEIGLLTDHVDDVLHLRDDEIGPPPVPASPSSPSPVRGVTANALVVLDAVALLRDRRLFSNRDTNMSAGSRNDDR